MVTGSIASAIHGEPRATRDVDVVIDPHEDHLPVLIAAFPPGEYYVGDAQAALDQRDMFNIIDLVGGWKVDLIVRKDRAFSREELRRRQPAVVAGIETFIATPEDAILSKLERQAMSRSDQQRRDVVEMLVANLSGLDRAYLEHWASELDVADLLHELWDEAAAAQ